MQRLSNVKAIVIPAVFGALGTIKNNSEKHLRAIGFSMKISCLQRTALLETAFILRRDLGISEGG